jgi:aminoglycoside phosphotransferase (APT) family kinase protein
LQTDWESLIDVARLKTWMDGQGLFDGPLEDIRPLSGGTQNVLLSFSRAGRRFVLRRPPANPRPQSNETMRREAQILRALSHTTVPHPRLVADCRDENILGVAFYLMEPIDGFNPSEGLPPCYRNSSTFRHRMGIALIDAIATLGRVDFRTVGLDGFGRTENFLTRQVNRWGQQLERYREYRAWAGPNSLPDVSRVAKWLTDNCPRSFQPGIIHGDFHLANVLINQSAPLVMAIVDWELATLGDPLLDLGWLLATWPDSDGSGGVFDIQPWSGFPTPSELIHRYAQNTTRDMSAIAWYEVLACYKLGILQEGTMARAADGLAPAAVGERLHKMAVALLERALSKIG